jgi:hypothetical protein
MRPDNSLVTIITTSRYPNELIKLGKVARRLQHQSAGDHRQRLCPVIPFAHLSLVVPSRSIPLIGYPTTISCIINYLVLELVNRQDPQLKHIRNGWSRCTWKMTSCSTCIPTTDRDRG